MLSLRCSVIPARAFVRSVSTNLLRHLRLDLEDMKVAGTYKTERVITSSQQAHIRVERAEGEPLNMWCVVLICNLLPS